MQRASHQTRSLSTHGALAPVECQVPACITSAGESPELRSSTRVGGVLHTNDSRNGCSTLRDSDGHGQVDSLVGNVPRVDATVLHRSGSKGRSRRANLWRRWFRLTAE